MTGFARVRRALEQGELTVSVKSVNHRALDLVIQSSSALDPFEAAIRAMVKERVARGHVEVRVSLPKSTGASASLTLNREFLHEYLQIFQNEAEAHDLDSKPDLNAALRIPGMLVEADDAGLVPDGDERAEGEPAPALHDGGATVDLHDRLRERDGGEDLVREGFDRLACAELLDPGREGARLGPHDLREPQDGRPRAERGNGPLDARLLAPVLRGGRGGLLGAAAGSPIPVKVDTVFMRPTAFSRLQ